MQYINFFQRVKFKYYYAISTSINTRYYSDRLNISIIEFLIKEFFNKITNDRTSFVSKIK